MISSTVVVAYRGSRRRWFDLDSVRTEQSEPDMERLRGVVNKRDRARLRSGVSGASNGFTQVNPAGAPPLDWHVDGLTATPTHDRNEEPMTLRYVVGDTRDVTATIPDGSVDLIFTSPPFLALRSYLPADHVDKHREIGSEANPAAFLDTLLELTAEWGRVLAPHGTLAVELGDTYSGASGWDRAGDDTYSRNGEGTMKKTGWRSRQPRKDPVREHRAERAADSKVEYPPQGGGTGWPLAKSLALIPQLYAVALAYGINPLTGQPSPAGRWRVRNWIAWHRPNPPVGALGDKWRPASSYITTACRGGKRWFDLDAVRTVNDRTDETFNMTERRANRDVPNGGSETKTVGVDLISQNPAGAPPLDWHTDGDLGVGHIILTTQPYAGSHYATFPMELPRKIIDCMCPRQVCRVCGMPRERVTQQTPEYAAARGRAERVDYQDGRYVAGRGGNTGRFSHGADKGLRGEKYETLGWTDCGCDETLSSYRPGHVLDPFAGTGTTLAAAQDLGRDATGIDIDEENAWLARERCGMFATFEHFERPVVDTADL